MIAAFLHLSAPAASAQLSCAPSAADRTWLEETVAAWHRVRQEAFHADAGPFPLLLLFDTECLWEVADDPRGGRDVVNGKPHGGTIRTPDGQALPPVLTSFASAHDGRSFVVMALPSIWKAAPNLKGEARIDLLIRSVFIHEMTHVAQAGVMNPAIGRLSQRLPNPDDLNDDIIQTVFGSDPAFRAAYERERDLLYAAAQERDDARRSSLAAQARRMIEERRARYFAGDREFYRELEDVFLVMEGAANWGGYMALRAAGVSESEALMLMRRGGRNWSQDEGLALFLLLDAGTPNWQRLVFGTAAPPSVPALLGQ